MKNILILDDDGDILFLYRKILKHPDWKIETLRDCKNILLHVKKYRPDLVLMDNTIPGGGGRAATKKLKNNKEYKLIPIIICSAHAEVESIARSAGADGWLKKPFDITELRTLVNNFLLPPTTLLIIINILLLT